MMYPETTRSSDILDTDDIILITATYLKLHQYLVLMSARHKFSSRIKSFSDTSLTKQG